jgi:hypothetical protein
MRTFLFFNIILSLFCSTNFIKAQCNLIQVGTTTVVANSALSDMAVAPDGKTYIFAYNSATKLIELSAAATISSTWTVLATVPTVTNTTVKPVIEINKNGEIILFVRDEGNGKVGKVYKFFGGSITQIGANVSTGTVTDLAIAFSSTNEIYISYTDVLSGNVAVVKRWGSAIWQDIGPSGIASGSSVAHFNSLILDKTNTPVIAYQDGSASNKITIRKYNVTSWVTLSTVATASTTNSKLKCANTGNYFISYVQGTDAIVQEYNGSVWTPVGSQISGFSSTADLFDMELDPADTPFIIGAESSSSKIVAYKYNEATWVQVPAGNISGSTSTNANISFDVTGAPYFSYVDNPANNTINVKTLSLLETISQPQSTLVCNGSAGSMSIAVTGTYSPTFKWQTAPTGYFLNALSPYTSTNTRTLSFVANPSIDQDKIRCVVNFGCRNAISSIATLTVASPSVTVTKTDATCFGACDGSIYSTATGGSPPYLFYLTPNGATTQSVSALCAGNYTSTISDQDGCSVSSIATINSPSAIFNSVSGNLNICNGSTTTLTANVSGGIGTYSISWSPAASLSSTTTSVVVASPTSTTIYTITTIDANSCSSSQTVSVVVNANPNVGAAASPSVICVGGSSSLTASGATSYLWSTGANSYSLIVSPITSIIYTVTGTNANGCSNSQTVSLVVNASPTIGIVASSSAICVGSSATITAFGADTYTWIPGNLSGDIQIVSPNAQTIYTIAGTSTLTGCANTATTEITVNSLPTATAGVTSTLTCANTNISLTGSGGINYLWTGPSIVSGATTSNPIVDAPGTYSLQVGSAAGCTSTISTVSVTQNTIAPSISSSVSGVLNCTVTSVNANATTTTTPVTYNWTGPGIISATNISTITANSPGTYNYTVMNTVNGCESLGFVNVTQSLITPSVVANTSGTITCLTNTIQLNGTLASGVTYSWSAPSGSSISSGALSQNAIGSGPGTYTLTVRSLSNGCPNSATAVANQNTIAPIPTANPSSSLTCSNSVITLNGGPSTGVTYLWSGPGITGSPSAQITTANSPGSYSLVVTNTINGCSASATTTVIQDIVTPTVSASSSGSITCITNTVQLSGSNGVGVTYNWSGPGFSGGTNTQNVISNSAGIYTLALQFVSNGCVSSATTEVMQDLTAPLGVDAGFDQSLTCLNSSVTLNGSVTSPTNAIINWTGSNICGAANTVSTSACAAGFYTLTVTDPINGCVSSGTVEVLNNTVAPNVIASVSNTLTCSNTTANIVATTTTNPVSNNWTGSGIISVANTPTINVNQSGTFTLVVTDLAHGCTTNTFVNVFQDITIPSISVTASSSVICAGTALTMTASGANTYSWAPGGQTTNSIIVSPVNSTTYTIIGTGLNGCTNSINQNISVNALPSISINGNTNICKGSSSLLNASGAVSYTWNSGATTNSISVTPTLSTSYDVTGEDGNGCLNTSSLTVNIISSKNISGIITSTAGATGGDIIIYKYTANLSQWDSLTITPIGGTYTFNNIDSGLYVLRAMPTATNIQVTYAPNSISWQGAGFINHGCTINTSQNINLRGLEPIALGTGTITGIITQASGFGARMSNESKPMSPGTPIGGIIVKGGKNPGGQMFVQTTTAEPEGTYTLTGLPLTGTDDYFIFVDIPGLDTNLTYHYVLTSGANQLNGLNFTVDSIYINPIANFVTGISNDQSVLESKITLFPNPANQKFSLEYELIKSANVLIELFDMLGKSVKMLLPATEQSKGVHKNSWQINDLSAGLYFIKISINGSESTIKLSVTK